MQDRRKNDPCAASGCAARYHRPASIRDAGGPNAATGSVWGVPKGKSASLGAGPAARDCEREERHFGGSVRPSLRWPGEQRASARWGRAQASRRPAQRADCQSNGTRRLEGHHTSRPQRVHLLGRGCQAGDDTRTPHSPNPGGVGGWPAPTLLLARMRTLRAHRQIAVGAAHPAEPPRR